METNKPLQFNTVLSRIQQYRDKQAAEAVNSVADPTNKGTVGIPSDPEATNKKQNIPANMDNTSSNEGTKLEDKQLHPVSTGKDVPATQDGNKKEDVSSPTDPLSKIASRAKAIAEKLKNKAASDTTPKNVPEKDKDEKTAPKPKTDAVEGVPSSETNSDAGKTKPPFGTEKQKEASNDAVASDLTPDVLAKLAHTILSTEGGLAAVEPVLMKAAGVEAARQMMKEAADSYASFLNSQAAYEEQIKQASYEEFMKQAAVNAQVEQFDEFMKSASEKDKEFIVKYASVHSKALEGIEEDILKQAYMQGTADAAAMEDAGGEALPEAEGAPSIEQIAELLQAMVEAGELDEQTAVAVLQELASAQGGDAAEGDPAAAAGAEVPAAAAPTEMPVEDPAAAEKGAAVKDEFTKGSNLVKKLIATSKK